MSQLNLLVKDAADISDKASALSDKIKILASSAESVGHNGLILAFTIFILACIVGYYVVWKVTPSLHTPLMSVTNAISGVVLIGGLAASSSPGFDISNLLGYFAVFFASINIFGGFIVTARMLEMFKKKDKTDK